MNVRGTVLTSLVLSACLACAQAPVAPGAGPSRDAAALARRKHEEAARAVKAKDFTGAERLMTESLEADASNPNAWYARSLVRGQLGAFEAAAADIDRALALGEDGRFRCFAGRVARERKLVDAGLVHARRCAELAPGDPKSWMLLADFEMASGQPGLALRAESEAIRLAPDDPEVKAHSEFLIRFAVDREPRLLALARTPPEALDHHARGEGLVKAQRWADAIGAYEAALRIAPRFADCHYNIGVAATALGDLDRAERAYVLAIELYEPEERLLKADALNNLAFLHVRRGRVTGDDVARVREAIAIDRERPSKLDTLARVCDALGDRPCAREAYGKLLASRDPVREEVRRNAAERLSALRDGAPAAASP